MISPFTDSVRTALLALTIFVVLSGQAAKASALYTVTDLGLDQTFRDPTTPGGYGSIGFDASGKITYAGSDRLQDGAYSIAITYPLSPSGTIESELARVNVSSGAAYDLTPPSNNFSTRAFAVNSSGTAVGYAFGGPVGDRAVVFTPSGGVRLLPTSNGTYGAALAINEKGQIVGYAATPTNGPLHGFLSSGTTAVDINTLIPKGLGLTIIELTGINDKGQIVGVGLDSQTQSQQHFVLLTPVSTPEPASLAVALMAIVACGFLTRRMKRTVA